MSLPFEPETTAQIAQRLLQALSPKIYAAEGEVPAYQPGLHRKHVFDFEDGMRMVLSRDHLEPTPGDCLHLSLSLTLDTPVYYHYARMADSTGTKQQALDLAGVVMGRVIREGVRRFRKLTGYEGNVTVASISDAGVPHMYIPWPEWLADGISRGVSCP